MSLASKVSAVSQFPSQIQLSDTLALNIEISRNPLHLQCNLSVSAWHFGQDGTQSIVVYDSNSAPPILINRPNAGNNDVSDDEENVSTSYLSWTVGRLEYRIRSHPRGLFKCKCCGDKKKIGMRVLNFDGSANGPFQPDFFITSFNDGECLLKWLNWISKQN